MTQTTLPPGALDLRELLAYTDQETGRWHDWLREQDPALLALPFGEGSRATVGDLIHHVFMVERRYADRLLGDPATPYDALARATVDELFAIHRGAVERLERFIATASEDDWRRELTFETLSAGTLSASKRKIVAHALVHGIRHWAQIATALRQAGHATGWDHDLVFSPALR
jgi:uncharacterized damage-inducible protein DinB